MTRRNKTKTSIINSFGGKCQICGYSKCLAALCFHHKDSSIKKFNISKHYNKPNMSYELAIELSNCILVCANCHFEIHQNMHNLSSIDPIPYENFLDVD